MCVITPRHGCRALKIELLGNIARNRTIRYEVLGRIIDIAAIQRGEFGPERILEAESEVHRLIAIKVSGLEILATNVM